jgi:hypothetical protein
MRSLLVLLLIALACFATGGFARAADSPPTPDGYVAPACDDADLNTLAAVDCAGIDGVPTLDPSAAADPPTVASLQAEAATEAATEPSPAWLPAYCREHVDAAFYTSSDWVRLGQKLLADATPCADYFISIPVLAADKTNFRCVQDDLIRALGPRFHPVAELHFAGWNAWWKSNNKTPAEAGREFVRRAVACGYDFAHGETWALNEMHSGIRTNVPGARANMIQLLDAVRDASGVPGIVWVIGVGQQTVNLSDYKPKLQEWLQDGPFWTAMAEDVWYWAQETYPDMRYWGVAAESRAARTDNLRSFVEHPLLLAENGPAGAAPALAFFEQTFASLTSAAWPWTSGFGNTAFPDDQMKRFVAEQTFAVKHFSLSRPHQAPGGRIAFAYAPGNNVCPNPDKWGTVIPCDGKTFSQLTAGILDRLASSIHYAYEQGGGTQAGACGPPGDRSWCSADVPNAAFNPVWIDFPSWETGG